jgi:hypothetical protein
MSNETNAIHFETTPLMIINKKYKLTLRRFFRRDAILITRYCVMPDSIAMKG